MQRCPECGRTFERGEIFCPFDGTRLSASVVLKADGESGDPLLGTTLDGKYPLERVLGRGGMGTVYASRYQGQLRAVKVLRHVDDDGEALARFEREARMATRLGQAHIVEVYDFGRAGTGHSYMAMELLQGEDLGDRLARETSLPLARAGAIVLQCCSGLGAAHAVGIVHRDLKPENVYLTHRGAERDFVKIVDFGLAKIQDVESSGDPGRKLTKTGMIFGTPQYMSPEQAMGRRVDHRADVYSLGVIFFELLSGRVPFDGNNFMSILNQHMLDPPPPLRPPAGGNVPADVEALVGRCLGKTPGERPQSMGELAAELERLLRSHGLGEVAERYRVHVDAPVERTSLPPTSGVGVRPSVAPGGASSPVEVGAHASTAPDGIDPSAARAALDSPLDSPRGAATGRHATKLASVPPPPSSPRTGKPDFKSTLPGGVQHELSIPPPAAVPAEARVGGAAEERALDPARVAPPREAKAAPAWGKTAPAAAAFARTEYDSLSPPPPETGPPAGGKAAFGKTLPGTGTEKSSTDEFARTYAGIPPLNAPASTRPSGLPVTTLSPTEGTASPARAHPAASSPGSAPAGASHPATPPPSSAAPHGPGQRPSHRPPRLGPESAVTAQAVEEAVRARTRSGAGTTTRRPSLLVFVGAALGLLLVGAALGFALLSLLR